MPDQPQILPQILPCDPADPRAASAVASYYAELAARFAQGFVAHPDTPEAQAALRPPLGTVLLALRGSETLGCVSLRPDAPGIAEVKRLWVSGAARGLGLGARLMAAAEDAARQLGYTRVRLDTNRTLTEAIALYRRLGWAEIARYNDNPYAEAWFEKPL